MSAILPSNGMMLKSTGVSPYLVLTHRMKHVICTTVLLYQGNLDILRFLLDQGAQVNCRGGNNIQQMPLHLAAVHGYDDILQLLLERGANPMLTDWRGMSPLTLAETTPSTLSETGDR